MGIQCSVCVSSGVTESLTNSVRKASNHLSVIRPAPMSNGQPLSRKRSILSLAFTQGDPKEFRRRFSENNLLHPIEKLL